MTRSQFVIALAVLLAGGMVGGFISERVYGGAVWAQGETPQLVTAREFQLLAADGTVRAQLGANEGGDARLVFRNGEGKRQLTAGMDDEGRPLVMLHDGQGTHRAQLGVNDEGVPLVILFDGNGVNRVQMSIYEDGPGALFSDAEGETRLRPSGTGAGRSARWAR